MISYQDAIALLLKQAQPLPAITVPLMQALGKTAAADVVSTINVPGFRNSAMDGVAVRAQDLTQATEQHPIDLKITTAIAAGDITTASDKDEAVQIMTGAEMPAVFDTVVPVELVNIADGYASFNAPAQTGRHIRNAGEDIARGDIILHKGQSITPEQIMLLAATGIDKVLIAQAPYLHIISTGNEISDDYDVPLSGAKIYNSNAPYLLASALKHELTARYAGIVRDDEADFSKKLNAINVPAIIISTGAVSKGKWDFIPGALEAMGAQVHFHQVNIKPGKPILFATLPNGSYYFGLPGNPVSSAIGFNFFVMPLIRQLLGMIQPQMVMARLNTDFTKSQNYCQFLKARLTPNRNGQLTVDIADGQESFKISPMATNNAWAVLDGERKQWQAGDLVSVASASFSH